MSRNWKQKTHGSDDPIFSDFSGKLIKKGERYYHEETEDYICRNEELQQARRVQRVKLDPHAPEHESGGSDPLSLDKLAGIITDGQHGARGAGLHADSHPRLHALSSALDHSGVITDAQHGTKATIPNAHHYRYHSHYKNYVDWNPESAAEVSTSSTTYVTLIESIRKTVAYPMSYEFSFSHNVKNEGTTAARGATFKIVGFDDMGEFEIGEIDGGLPTELAFRWTDGLADYKLMTVVAVRLVSQPIGQLGWRIKWKVDLSGYPCWSKNRFFVIRSFDEGGGVMSEG